MMNLQTMILDDHDTLLALFDELESAEPGERRRLVEVLEEALAAHIGIRELLVHPLLRKTEAATLADRALADHTEISRQLKRFRRLRPDDFLWPSALNDLWLTVEDHLLDEEAVVLPILESRLSAAQLQRLEHHFMSLKVALPDLHPAMRPAEGSRAGPGRPGIAAQVVPPSS